MTQPALIYVPPGKTRDLQKLLIYLWRDGHRNDVLILRDWTEVDWHLQHRSAIRAIVARTEYRAIGRPIRTTEGLAPVIRLDDQRAITETRHIACWPYAGQHREMQGADSADCIPIRTAVQRIEDAARRWRAWRPPAAPTL